MANTINVSVLADVRDIRNKLGSVDNQLSGFGKATKRIGGLIAGAFAGTAVVSGLKTMVSSASDLNETISKTKTIFGDSSPAIMKWSKQAATNLGLSRQSALDGISTFGNFFNQIGIGAKETEKMSKGFVQAAVDLGSFHNAAPTEVMDALSAATRGEYDSLQKFIPTINAAKVEMEAMRATGKKSAKELTDQDKARAVSALVMKGQGKAAGDFARTQDSLANKTKIAKAQFDNLVANLGTALLPIVTDVMGFISDTAIPKLTEWGNIFKDKVVPAVKDLGGFLKDTLLPPLSALGDFMRNNPAVVATFAGVILTVVGAMKAWAAIQAVLNVLMTANPIGLVVIALAALAAGLVYAYKNSETFRNIVNKAFAGIRAVAAVVFPAVKEFVVAAFNKVRDAIGSAVGFIRDKWGDIKGATQAAWSFIKDKIASPIADAYSTVKDKVSSAKQAVANAWDAVKEKTANVWNGVLDTVRNKIADVKEKVDGIKDKITGAFSGAANWLTQAGKDVIAGLVAGLEAAKQWVVDKIQEIADKIPNWVKKRLGIASPSKVMKELGRFVSQGLAIGIEEGGQALDGVMSNIGDKVAKFYEDRYPKSKKAAQKATQEFTNAIKGEAHKLRENLAAQKANNDSLQAAKQQLQEAKDKVTSYAAAVRDATLAFGSLLGIGKREQEDGTFMINTQTIIEDLSKKVADAQRFASLIQTLTAAGLNQTNLDQLIQGGVDAGLATAEALAAGGPGAIAQINSLTAQLQAVGTSMGNATAETMHGAGVQAAQGLVDGFESMAERLEKAGDKLAKKMVKAIKKALDINSPSRVMRDLGVYVGQGLVGGINSTQGIVTRAGSELARSVEDGFTAPQLTLNSTGAGNTPAQPVININVNGSVVDGAKEGKKIADYLDAYYSAGGRRLAI